MDGEDVEDGAEGILHSERRNETGRRISRSCSTQDEADEALW
jgi:hypothetical protein